MKTRKLNNYKTRVALGLACITIGGACLNWNAACQAQGAGNLSPNLQEVVKLSQSQMGDDVIISYIKNTGQSYQLSADDMVYLKSQGVSQNVLAVLLQARAAAPAPTVVVTAPVVPTVVVVPTPAVTVVTTPPPPVAVEAAPPPAPEVNFNYFHDQLAPFGTWIDVGGVQFWRPDSALRANPDWRPYYDMGRWTETENGLFWQSDYQWGDIPFHYGRWVLNPQFGWLWYPDYTWGPAWVFWRHAEADGAIGWAPLPVGAVFVDGAFVFNGVHVGLDFDFGLGEAAFTFVDYDHFHEGFFRMRGREYAYHIHGDRFHEFYHRSVVRNEFRRDEHGRFVNEGIGHDRMERATHGRVERASFEERNPTGDRNKLAAERGHEAGRGDAHDAHGAPGHAEPGHSDNHAEPGRGGAPGAGARPTQTASAAPSKVFRPSAPAAAARPAAAPSHAAAAPASSSSKKK